MKYRHLIILPILLLIFAQSFAATLTNLYTTTIPVQNQSDAERAKILPEALSQVLIKVSGNPKIVKNAQVKSQLANAAKILRQYSYQQINSNGQNFLGLIATFDSNAVNQILSQANQAVWSPNRPLVLVWLLIQNQQNNLVSNNPNDPLVQYLQQDAYYRGLPIAFPQWDVIDQQQLNLNDLTNTNIAKILQASQRYNADAILIGNASQQGNQWHANWLLLNNDKQARWTSQGSVLNQVLAFGINSSADVLAQNYIVPVTQNAVTQTFTIIVTNVNNIADYARVSQYLQNLSVVKQVDLNTVEQNQLTFTVQVAGGENALLQAISLEHTLKALPNNNMQTNPQQNILYFQWLL